MDCVTADQSPNIFNAYPDEVDFEILTRVQSNNLEVPPTQKRIPVLLCIRYSKLKEVSKKQFTNKINNFQTKHKSTIIVATVD